MKLLRIRSVKFKISATKNTSLGATRFNYPLKEVRTSHVSLSELLKMKYNNGGMEAVSVQRNIWYIARNSIFSIPHPLLKINSLSTGNKMRSYIAQRSTFPN